MAHCFVPILVWNYGFCCIIQMQQTELTSKECVEKFCCAIVPTYRKGAISKTMELDLLQRMPQAIERAEKRNPSTTVFEFIKALGQ